MSGTIHAAGAAALWLQLSQLVLIIMVLTMIWLAGWFDLDRQTRHAMPALLFVGAAIGAAWAIFHG